MDPAILGRILSIQSHVVHGYVGNKAAVFPLQCQGFEVDAIHTVHYSNHTGYGVFKGSRLNVQEFTNIMEALRSNQLIHYDAILSGYVGQVEILQSLSSIVKALKQENENLVYALDPVMGDDGKFYVSTEYVAMYKELLCPLADLITPNQFEAECLTGIKIMDQKSAKEALIMFHSMGIRRAIITSCDMHPRSLTLYASQMNPLASTVASTSTMAIGAFQIVFPKIEGVFSGTGDCTSALLLGYTMQGLSLEQTCLLTLTQMQNLLLITKAQSDSHLQIKMELALIHARKQFFDGATMMSVSDTLQLEYI